MQILPLRKLTAVLRILAAFLLAVAVAMLRVISIGADVPVPLGPSPLPYTSSYLVTGDFASTTLDLVQTSTGKLKMSGVPKDADILAAFMYVEAIHQRSRDPRDVLAGATFRNQPLNSVRVKSTSKDLTGPTTACYSSNTPLAMTIYRADVLKLLPRQLDKSGKPTGKLLVNDADLPQTQKLLFSLPDTGGNSGQQFAGATLVVVYRDPAPNAPLRKIVVNDGLYILDPGEEPEQKIGGFYSSDPLNKKARVMVIGGAGQKNTTDSLLFNGAVIKTDAFPASSSSSDRSVSDGAIDVSSKMPGTVLGDFGETVTMKITHGKTSPYECIALEATWFSTTVADRDGDGKPDRLEQQGTGPLKNPDGQEQPYLWAMGATDDHKDAFFEFIALKTTAPTTRYGSEQAPYDSTANPIVKWVDAPPHNHMPPSDVILKFVQVLNSAPVRNLDNVDGIRAHVDIGDPATFQSRNGGSAEYAIPPALTPFLVAQSYARGGELELETACTVDPQNPTACQFPDYPGTLGWGYSLQKFLLGPSATYPNSVRFDSNREGLFSVGVHVHTRGKPKSLPCLDVYGNLTLYDPALYKVYGETPNSCAVAANPPWSATNPTGFRPQDYHVNTSSSGAGALPGHQFITSLGRWENFVGKPISRLTAILHEWGHNVGLWHGGAPARLVYDGEGVVKIAQDNCKTNYLSVMSYLFQGDGVKDLANKGHAVLSSAVNQTVRETDLKDFAIAGGLLPFRTAWFAPLNQGGLVDSLGKPATKLCNGLPFPGGVPIAMGRFDALTLSPNIDWATNGFVLNQSAANQDVNLDTELTVMEGFDDWSNIRLNQAGSGHIMGGAISMGGSDFGGSDFGGSDFGGSDFGGSDFGGSDFGGSDFGGSDFGGIDLDGSDFGGSDFGGSDFGGTGFAGDAEMTHEDAVALGSTAPAEVSACVIGGDSAGPNYPRNVNGSLVGSPACEAGATGQLHRTRLTFKAPEIVPDTTATDPVTLYRILRSTGGQPIEIATQTPTAAGCPVVGQLCTYFDNEEFPDGLPIVYSVKADFSNGTTGNAASTSITARNDAPVAIADARSTDEDTPLTAPITVLNNDSDPDSGNAMTALLVSQATNGVAVLNANGTFTYSPSLNFYGTDTFTYKLVAATWPGPPSQPMSADSATVIVTITVNPVNDRPSFTTGAEQTVAEDSGAQTVAAWATAISAGPTNEITTPCPAPFGSGPPACGQTVSFFVSSNTNPSLFSAGPAVNSSGALTYTPAPDKNGEAIVEVYAQDNGGTLNGGADASLAQSFKITVTPVNDQPTANAQSVETTANTSTPITLIGSDKETLSTNLTFNIVSGPTHGTLSGDAPNIEYLPATDYDGPDSFTFTVTDRGDPDNCGTPATLCAAATTSEPATVSITVFRNEVMVVARNDESPTSGGTFYRINLDTGAVQSAWTAASNFVDVAVTPNHNTALVSAFYDQKVHFVDLVNGTPFTFASTAPMLAEDIDSDATGTFAVVADGNPEGGSKTVKSILISTQQIIDTETLPFEAEGATFVPNHPLILVNSLVEDVVSVLSISGNGALNYVTAITVGDGPINVQPSPNGKFALVPNFFAGTISILRISDSHAVALAGTVTPAPGQTFNSPQSIAFDPTGSKAYVAMTDGTVAVLQITEDGDLLSVIDTGARIFDSTARTSFFGVDQITATGNGRYVVAHAPGKVTVIDPATNTIVRVIPIADDARGGGIASIR
jgi:VCBS repeat-containing protein